MLALSRYTLLVVLIGNSFGATAQVVSLHGSRSSNGGVPTPVAGESWLTHLSRPFNETSMGKTGALGPASDAEDYKPVASNIAPPTAQTTLSGADLYRLNCQGCHGAEGLGAPPEINSVINPVRATSVPLVMQSMKTRGVDISSSAANELAKEARIALLKRLHQGGEKMPSFAYLAETEMASLVAYLNQLAVVPGAEKEQKTVRESPERVGELIVKSTCHTCHDAAGPNPTEQQLFQGEIPPLETLTARVGETKFIRKVTHGLPILMGDPAILYRGRMPVFYYLTPQEAADAYLYLSYYPPISGSRTDSVIASTQPPTAASGGGGPLRAETESASSPVEPRADSGITANTLVLLAGVFVFVLMLLVGGLAFTIREFNRMSARRVPSPIADHSLRRRPHQSTGHRSNDVLSRYRAPNALQTTSQG